MGFKQATMVLYSDPDSLNGHRVRIALAEKGMSVNVEYIKRGSPLPTAITSVVEDAKLPILVDRELVLYDTDIITEYLDERFPHPPLLPVNPIQRARYRLMMREIDKQWLQPANIILTSEDNEIKKKAKALLTARLIDGASAFNQNNCFIGEEFSLVDCCLLPMLWRLSLLNLKLPSATLKTVRGYMNKMFERRTFKDSLSEEERDFEVLA